ncbi:hypothetical protein EVAR_60592_1 [Eumeta japonica]|uniref:Uncharacterized protein n=1 Tax=Eumeta variegata TaxID=151549 RepID=A0A4C1YI08_EUMVA|nr:hypothetical protein EVAR_60592_1 [Eumeta japonica]
MGGAGGAGGDIKVNDVTLSDGRCEHTLHLYSFMPLVHATVSAGLINTQILPEIQELGVVRAAGALARSRASRDRTSAPRTRRDRSAVVGDYTQLKSAVVRDV